jgi:hypothetical protein
VENLGSYGVGNCDTGGSGVREINRDTFGSGVVVFGLQRNRRADIMMANLTNFFVGNRLGCARGDPRAFAAADSPPFLLFCFLAFKQLAAETAG